jgi:hypothetical protein
MNSKRETTERRPRSGAVQQSKRTIQEEYIDLIKSFTVKPFEDELLELLVTFELLNPEPVLAVEYSTRSSILSTYSRTWGEQ